jgi:dolichol-phosphate mannosyltransferase
MTNKTPDLGVSIAVVIPCYRVKTHIMDVLDNIPDCVSHIYCIDDACPDGSGDYIEEKCHDKRVKVLRHTVNQGVGGAVITGYKAAKADNAMIAVKIDGDGQMDPQLLPYFVKPIIDGEADYTKGNRFYFPANVRSMPRLRLFGNIALSFITKISSGYWDLFDPTNGYTALHLSVLDLLSIDRIAKRYFFETDMLYRLNICRCVVRDIPMEAIYGDEQSSLKIKDVLLSFAGNNLKNFVKRVVYNYFLRDFNVASLEILFGPLLLLSGLLFGGYEWYISILNDEPATAGTVMIAALQIILGVMFLLSALNYDIQSVPRNPVHKFKRKMDILDKFKS